MNAIRAIKKELKRAKKLHPGWPKDIVHQMAIITEESGEAMQATLNHVYHGGSHDLIKHEIIQTAAMCLRWLENNK